MAANMYRILWHIRQHNHSLEFNLRLIATISTKYDIYILRRFAQKSPNVGDLIKYFIPLATCSIKSSSQVKEVSAFRIQQQTKKLSVHIWKYSIAKLDTMEWNNVDNWSSDPGLAKIKKPKWIPDRCQAPILWKYGNAWWWQSYSIEDWCWDIYTVSMNPATLTASYEWLLPPHNASISCPANFRSHQTATNHNIQYSVCRPLLADVGTQYISNWYHNNFISSSWLFF